MDKIFRRYLPERNPTGAYLPGVPLRDLTRADYDALPDWLKVSVDRVPFYAAPRAETRPEPPAKE